MIFKIGKNEVDMLRCSRYTPWWLREMILEALILTPYAQSLDLDVRAGVDVRAEIGRVAHLDEFNKQIELMYSNYLERGINGGGTRETGIHKFVVDLDTRALEQMPAEAVRVLATQLTYQLDRLNAVRIQSYFFETEVLPCGKLKQLMLTVELLIS